ncbi:MAG: BT_3928 family protein [Bacteroidales bacterium]|jgi:uncharacterized membrane protein YphA (DoxX/SURF4 family)
MNKPTLSENIFKIIAVTFRILVGLVFIFSGFVKAIDPLGLTYKLQEYFIVYYIQWLSPLALCIAIFFCMLEFVTGVALLFNLRVKIFSWLALGLMIFFTIQTYFSAIFNLVSDCGCFGDAIHLTNWQTFYKNVVLIILTFFIFSYRKKYKSILTIKGQSIFPAIAIAFILLISVYCYRHLPLIDFLPWKVGNKISEQVVPTPEVAKIYLVYKNTTTGETKEFTTEEYTKSGVWKDSLWMKNWKFVEQKKEIITPFKDAPIHDFKIIDQNGKDHTDAVINQPNYNFLLIAHSLEKTNKKAFLKINNFVKQCDAENIIFIALTATSFDKIDYFRHDVQAMYDFYNVDETALKTMIRSNPGLILLKNGTVIAKWHYNDFPELNYVKEKYFK